MSFGVEQPLAHCGQCQREFISTPIGPELCPECECDFHQWADMCDDLRDNAAEVDGEQELCGL